MELKEDSQVLGIWFAGGVASDWLAIAVVGNGTIHAEMRFRYYEDDKTFDSSDKKDWYDFRKDDTPENREAVVSLLDVGLEKAVTEFGYKEGAKFPGGTGKEAFDWLQKQSFCEMRKATSEEVKKLDEVRKDQLN